MSGSGSQLSLGIQVLDAVERDFDCAGFCLNSKFYAFSEVSKGPPTQTCVKGINTVMDKAATITLWSGMFFFVATLFGLVLSCIYTCFRVGGSKRNNFNELQES